MSTWFRFTTQGGTVYGEVVVPGTPPLWFSRVLQEINEKRGEARPLTMSDFSAAAWLDEISSANRPIQLRKPLSPQPQEELLFFAEGRLEAMQEAVKSMAPRKTPDGTETPGIAPDLILRDDEFVRKYAVFMDDFDKIPESERTRYRPVPRSRIQKNKGRTFVNYVPLMDPNSEEEDLESYVLYPGQVSSRVQVKITEQWRRMVHGIYGGIEVAASSDVPRILPRA
jgi:hypothetical protein